MIYVLTNHNSWWRASNWYWGEHGIRLDDPERFIRDEWERHKLFGEVVEDVFIPMTSIKHTTTVADT